MRRRQRRPRVQKRTAINPQRVDKPILSVGISIYNRSDLLRWGMLFMSRSTMPAKAWQIVLVDDGSTQDLSKVYKPYIGKLNIVHIIIDHKKHPIWRQMNPKWQPGQPENRTHTPALTTNVFGRYAHRSKTPYMCFSQPEMLVSPNAFERGMMLADGGKNFVFPDIALTPPSFRETLTPEVAGWPFAKLWQRARNQIQQAGNPTHYKVFPTNENYWMLAWLGTEWFMQVNGVDEEYLRGAYCEDDNIRKRLEMAGVRTIRDSNMYGIHLDHSHEQMKTSRRAAQWRQPRVWGNQANTNRARWAKFLENPAAHGGFIANQGKDWGSEKCVVDTKEFLLHT